MPRADQPEKPDCECPHDDELGAILHVEGCDVIEWYRAEVERRRLWWAG